MATPEDIALDPQTLIRVGIVASVDLANALCTVKLSEEEGEDVVTPPLRWLMGRAGATRIWSPPSVDEQVLLLSPDGQIGAAVVLTGLHSDMFPPAASTDVEVIQFTDGAIIRYDPASHVLTATLPEGSSAEISCETISITGNVSIDGDVTITGTATAQEDVIGGGKSLKGHKHTGVQPGGGVSGAPQ